MRQRRLHRPRGPGSACLRVEMTPAALGFLELLQDLGHLDETLVEQIIESLAPGLGAEVGETPVKVEYEDVRRGVARLLLDEQVRLPTPQRELLTKEWLLLFG